jgi:hypothetical protein
MPGLWHPAGVHMMLITVPGVSSRCGAPQPPATVWHPSGMADATPQGCQE